jgi:protein phosphatase
MSALEVCSRTDVGKVRPHNEDGVLVANIAGCHILAVADGLGGHAAGEVASRVALIELEQYLGANLTPGNVRVALADAITKANREIHMLSAENPSYAGMGSTLVAALVCNERVVVANVGDSRAYIIDGGIDRITKDHSLVQELVDRGMITREEAFDHPQRNIVTRTLGLDEEVSADLYELDLGSGTLLLCSDGLTDCVRDEAIHRAITNAASLDTACGDLVDMANAQGGLDNITLILAREGTR